eukprot:scaffold682_cov363-Pavlova_lutheri.AAC.58
MPLKEIQNSNPDRSTDGWTNDPRPAEDFFDRGETSSSGEVDRRLAVGVGARGTRESPSVLQGRFRGPWDGTGERGKRQGRV